jgi:hypothetical protein
MNPLESIEAELKELRAQRVEIDQKLVALEDAQKLLSQVYGPPISAARLIEQFLEGSDVGITDAVRGAYRLNADRKLAASQIRDIIAESGFDLRKYKNAMATIHQVISRLIDAEEIEGPFQQGDEKVYKWREKAALPIGRVQPAYYIPASSDPITTPPVTENILKRLSMKKK